MSKIAANTEPKMPRRPPPYWPTHSPILFGVIWIDAAMLFRSNEVWNVALTQLITEVRVFGSELARSDSWETKTPPKSAVSPRTMIRPRIRTIPVASPRRTPRRTIHSTGGSMAMENSQASSRMKRNVPIAWNAQCRSRG